MNIEKSKSLSISIPIRTSKSELDTATRLFIKINSFGNNMFTLQVSTRLVPAAPLNVSFWFSILKPRVLNALVEIKDVDAPVSNAQIHCWDTSVIFLTSSLLTDGFV